MIRLRFVSHGYHTSMCIISDETPDLPSPPPSLPRRFKTDKSSFRALYFAMLKEEEKEPSVYKLICVGPEERVVGLHIIGLGSDEITQGFGVAIKMGGECP